VSLAMRIASSSVSKRDDRQARGQRFLPVPMVISFVTSAKGLWFSQESTVEPSGRPVPPSTRRCAPLDALLAFRALDLVELCLVHRQADIDGPESCALPTVTEWPPLLRRHSFLVSALLHQHPAGGIAGLAPSCSSCAERPRLTALVIRIGEDDVAPLPGPIPDGRALQRIAAALEIAIPARLDPVKLTMSTSLWLGGQLAPTRRHRHSTKVEQPPLGKPAFVHHLGKEDGASWAFLGGFQHHGCSRKYRRAIDLGV